MQLYVGKTQIRLEGKSKPDIFIVFPTLLMLAFTQTAVRGDTQTCWIDTMQFSMLALHAICSMQSHSNMLDRQY
jgi:hypothetical protein